MNSTKIKKLTPIILKGIGLAMGIAVLVLNILGSIENDTSIRLLSLGVVSYGLHLFQSQKD